MRTSRPLFTQEMAPLCPKPKARRARVRVSVTGSDPREHTTCSSNLGSCLSVLPCPLIGQSHLHPVPIPGSDGEKGARAEEEHPVSPTSGAARGSVRRMPSSSSCSNPSCLSRPTPGPPPFSEPSELLSCSHWASSYAQPHINACIMTKLRLEFSLNCACLTSCISRGT